MFFPFDFCFGSQKDEFSICGITKKADEKSPLLSNHSQNETVHEPQITPAVFDVHSISNGQAVQHASVPSEPTSNHLPALSDILPAPIEQEQSSFLDIPEPDTIETQQKSTHHDEELGLQHYVSMHNIAGKHKSQRKLTNDGVQVKSARHTGHQREIILNYGHTERDTEPTPLPSTINIWQSKQPLAEFETPVISSNMISVHNNFILADDTNGLYAFDAKRNEWDLWIKYSIDLEILEQAICYDPMRNVIYLMGEIDDWATMIYIDITTKQTEIIKDDLENIGTVPFMLMIENTLNLFTGVYEESVSDSESDISSDSDGDNKCQKHLIWNDDTRDFELVFAFPQGVYGDGIVYIASKKVLLLLDKDGIWTKYDNQEWTKACDVELPIRTHRYQCTLSRYENYFLAYGCGDGQNKIFVFNVQDLGNVTYLESMVRSPKFGENYKCLAENNETDEMLVVGYVREMTELLDIDVSNRIITVIEMMYIEQYIHVISDENCHYKAVLHHILDYNHCNDYC
eukprot:9712_1